MRSVNEGNAQPSSPRREGREYKKLIRKLSRLYTSSYPHAPCESIMHNVVLRIREKEQKRQEEAVEMDSEREGGSTR
jgi:hypothetical protein